MVWRGLKVSRQFASNLKNETGSALIEFVVLGLAAQVILLGASVPLLLVQQHQLAAVSAAKLVGRAAAAGDAISSDYLESVQQVVASNFGVDVDQVRILTSRSGGVVSVRALVQNADYRYSVAVPR